MAPMGCCWVLDLQRLQQAKEVPSIAILEAAMRRSWLPVTDIPGPQGPWPEGPEAERSEG